jgi:hypothetical protein
MGSAIAANLGKNYKWSSVILSLRRRRSESYFRLPPVFCILGQTLEEFVESTRLDLLLA